MIDTDKYAELTIDDWHNLKAHQWEEVMHSYCNIVRVNESLRFELDGKHEDGLKWIEKCEELDAEVKRLREGIGKVADNMAKLVEAYSSHLADEEVADWIDGFMKDMLEMIE